MGRTVVDSNANSVDVVWLEEVVIDRHHCHLGDEIGERDAVRVRYTPREGVAGEVGHAVACVVKDSCHKLLLLGHIKLVVVLVRLREDAQLQKHVALRQCCYDDEVGRDARDIKLVSCLKLDLVGFPESENVGFDEDCLGSLEEQVVAVEIDALEASDRILAGPPVGQV